MIEYTIHPLVIGANETDQGIMTYIQGYGRPVWIPMLVFLIKGGPENIIVDTGIETFMVPENLGPDNGFEVLEFEEALGRHGLTPEDIDVVIQTHLHIDHCENTPKCTRAKVVVQRLEREFSLNPHPIDTRYWPELLDGMEVEIVDGDVTFRDGIDLLLTPGHTPGCQSVSVNTSAGRAIITGFCCNGKNFPPKGPVITPGVHTDALAAYASAHRIRELADILIPNHELSIGARKVIPDPASTKG